MKIAPDTLRTARVDARVPTRVAAEAANVSVTSLERLERTGDAEHITLGALTCLAETVGLTLRDLICPDTTHAVTSDDVDEQLVAALGAALHASHRPASNTALADAAATDLKTVQRHLDELGRRLQPLGLTLARTSTHTALTARPTRIAPTDLRDAERRTATRAHIDAADARILYAVLHGATEKKLRSSANGYARTGALINAGLIQPGEAQNRPMTLSDSVLYALGLDQP